MATALESEFRNLSLQEDSIKPGLFHLSLNLLYQLDSDTLNERKKLLDIQLSEKIPTCHPILKNLIALINHRLPRRQIEVIDILEGIKKENPNHLNTLANLEVVYKELHRQTESDSCRKEMEVLLSRSDREAMELKAQCVLEQAYSLIIEETTNHEGIANHRLRDSLKIISSEHERSSGERKEYLGKALRHAEAASSCVLSAMFCDRPDEKLLRKKDAIEKFKQGLKILESIGNENTIEYHIWRFTLGVAYNRYDFSIFQEEDDHVKHTMRKELIADILQIFWSTICDMDVTDESGLYTARSYAYIGHLLVSRMEIVKEIVTSKESKLFQEQSFMKLLEYPLVCFERALEKRPRDQHVLNRYGKSLKNKAKFQTIDMNEKIKLHLMAYNYVTQSIEILPHNNWFAYVTRMSTSKDLAELLPEMKDHDVDALIEKNESNFAILAKRRDSKSWLEEARLDGVRCFNSKATESDLKTLAGICQMLAKYPEVKRYGPGFVKNKKYIYEAIHYLNYALEIGGFINYTVVFNLSGCLYEIEEYRPAIEWMKRAMNLARRTGRSEPLTRILQYILALYKAESSEGDPSKNYLFYEMQFWISQGKSKFSDTSGTISYLCRFYAGGMFDFIKYLLSTNQSNAESRRSLISSCLDALKKYHSKKEQYQQRFKDCEDELQDLHSPAVTVEHDRESSAQYIVPDIVMPFSLEAKIQHSRFKYDFFVSHSNVNRDWVNNYLLYQLETRLHDKDNAFKGCIADRDFTPGRTILRNIIDAVEHSCKIIFVITEDFIKSKWCDYEVEQALGDMMNAKKKDCIIPILLEKIEVQRLPKTLASITYLDLTDESKHLQEVMKLKRALLI